MINKIAKLLKKLSSEVVEEIVRQVAEQSIEDVCEQVASHVDEMTLAEARGYVRARAAGIVRRQARVATSRHQGANQYFIEAIARAATERILPIVLRRAGVGVPRPQELPMVA